MQEFRNTTHHINGKLRSLQLLLNYKLRRTPRTIHINNTKSRIKYVHKKFISESLTTFNEATLSQLEWRVFNNSPQLEGPDPQMTKKWENITLTKLIGPAGYSSTVSRFNYAPLYDCSVVLLGE
jgi:hypothetical protein